MIELSELLTKAGVHAGKTIVMRHQPTAPGLRGALRWLAAENTDLYNHYQCCQGLPVEKAVTQASHLVSLVADGPGKALFVGVYCVNGWRTMHGRDWAKLEASRKLLALGDRGVSDRRIKLFNLEPTQMLREWMGRLVFRWPTPERAWWRWANRNEFLVDAIHPESQLVKPPPPWNEIVLTMPDLQALPGSWRARLSQWRGIYLILDSKSGRGYVGSAYGSENILSRWRTYANTGHGGNKGLQGLDSKEFRFSILQLVAPDLEPQEVIKLEESWKNRLGTREFGLNKN